MREQLIAQGFEIAGYGPDEYAAFIRAEIAKWRMSQDGRVKANRRAQMRRRIEETAELLHVFPRTTAGRPRLSTCSARARTGRGHRRSGPHRPDAARQRSDDTAWFDAWCEVAARVRALAQKADSTGTA